MSYRIIFFALVSLILLTLINCGRDRVKTIEQKKYTLHFDQIDSYYAKQIEVWLDEGQNSLIDLFKADFKKEFDVHVFQDRNALDQQWQVDWNMPDFKSQCWMVASGIGHRLDILSPRVWKEQACEHDVNDTVATKKIIIHEMIHVYHGQYNPSPDFADVENIDWFVEGVAVYLSGQLDTIRFNDTRDLLLENEGPALLSEIWKGQYRYGLAGSMVKHLHDNFGIESVQTLFGFTSADQILESLETTEAELISAWKTGIQVEK